MPAAGMNFFSLKIIRLYIKATKNKDHNKNKNKSKNKNKYKRENKNKRERKNKKKKKRGRRKRKRKRSKTRGLEARGQSSYVAGDDILRENQFITEI